MIQHKKFNSFEKKSQWIFFKSTSSCIWLRNKVYGITKAKCTFKYFWTSWEEFPSQLQTGQSLQYYDVHRKIALKTFFEVGCPMGCKVQNDEVRNMWCVWKDFKYRNNSLSRNFLFLLQFLFIVILCATMLCVTRTKHISKKISNSNKYVKNQGKVIKMLSSVQKYANIMESL